MALVVLGFAACQTEPEFDVNMGDGTTTISVVLPEDAVTRADENDSALGGLDNTTGETVRVIFEVYYEGETNADLRQVKYLTEGELQTNFDVRLVPGRNYTFVAWADMVNGVDAGDKYYDTSDLMNVTLATNQENKWTAMNESRDAFTATKFVEDFQSTSTIELKLVRPFAKLRIVTTDMAQLNDLDIKPTTATVEYTVNHYNAFNAFAGKVIGDSKNRNIKHENFDIKAYGDNVADVSKVLFTDYFFAAEDDVVKFTLNVYDQDREEIGAIKDFTTDIPVKRNNLTTIKGNVLTEANNIKVEVTPAFEDESVLPYELLQVLENGGEYKFENDMTIFKTLFINDDTNVVLDLNGKNITLATENEGLEYGDGIIVYGNLTIKGEGTIASKTRTIWARGNYGAEVNILGGHFIGANDTTCEVIYASGDGKINIYGGKFEAVTMDDKSFAAPQYAILNLQNNGKSGCDIKVYGGSFKNFNPSDNVSENPKHDFCAEGYTVVAQDDNWFKVVAVATATSTDEFTNAINNNYEAIDVVDNLNFGTNGISLTNDVTIEGNDNTITAGGKSTKNASLSMNGVDVTVKNANIVGGSIMAYYGANLVLDNVNLTYNYTQSGRNMIYAASDTDKQVVAVIDGGTFDMTGGSGNTYVCAHGNAIVYIKGGTFTGKGPGASNAPLNAIAIGNYKAQIIISGGTFDFNPSVAYTSTHGNQIAATATIAEGYKVVDNGNNTWTVIAE